MSGNREARRRWAVRQMAFYSLMVAVLIYGFIVVGLVKHIWVLALIFALCIVAFLAMMAGAARNLRKASPNRR